MTPKTQNFSFQVPMANPDTRRLLALKEEMAQACRGEGSVIFDQPEFEEAKVGDDWTVSPQPGSAWIHGPGTVSVPMLTVLQETLKVRGLEPVAFAYTQTQTVDGVETITGGFAVVTKDGFEVISLDDEENVLKAVALERIEARANADSRVEM